jgi:hypothetical protein
VKHKDKPHPAPRENFLPNGHKTLPAKAGHTRETGKFIERMKKKKSECHTAFTKHQ